MDCWREIKRLKGKTLKTLDNESPFDIIDVTDRGVVVRPDEQGNERRIDRQAIEGAFNQLIADGEITQGEIRESYTQFNPVYVIAILAALPGVKHSSRLNRLHYTPDEDEAD